MKPKYGVYADRALNASEHAREATNMHFGIKVGNARLDQYTQEQALYFVQILFNDKNIHQARIIPEPNRSTGFNEFYICAWNR